MEERSIDQTEQFDLLECYTFFQEVHAHNLAYMFVNPTCIYVPPIDRDVYGIEDVMDILEEKQKEETFVFEVSIPKCNVTERKLRPMVAFANHLGMSIYISVADYLRVKRKSENLYGVSSIILDLDTYHSVYEYDSDGEIFQVMKPVIDRIGIEPHMYVNSGHGRYLAFSFNNINLSAPSMRKLYQKTVKKLIYHFKEFGADAKCSDITRSIQDSWQY